MRNGITELLCKRAVYGAVGGNFTAKWASAIAAGRPRPPPPPLMSTRAHACVCLRLRVRPPTRPAAASHSLEFHIREADR